MQRNRNRRAFTIVELVIVIAVIAILAAVLIPTLGDVIGKAQDSRALQEAKNAYTSYFIDHAAEALAVEYTFYDANGRWVALYNGTPVGAYKSADIALEAMGLDPLEGLTDLGGGLYAYGGSIEVPVEPIAPVTPVDPNPPAGTTVYAVTLQQPSNVTLDGKTTAFEGYPYTARIIGPANHMPPKVTVKMNNVDITSTTYEDGVLNIPGVTGDVTIEANADSIMWEVGAIDIQTGEIIAATDCIYTELIDVSGGVTVTFDNYHSAAAFCPVYYNEDMSFAYAPDNFTIDALTLFPGQCKYMRLMACSQPSVDLTTSFALNLTISVGTSDMIWSSGMMDSKTGENKKINCRIRTGFIDIRNGNVDIEATYGQFCVWFYDENMSILAATSEYLKELDFSDSSAYYQYYVQKASYIRLIVRKSSTVDDMPVSEDFGERNITVTFTPQAPSQD